MLVVISGLVVGFLNTMLDALEMGICTGCWMMMMTNGCELEEWKWLLPEGSCLEDYDFATKSCASLNLVCSS